ncbi:MAG: hypothetical protein HYU83_03070 [Chloroflexi bacterium]|nr:hypothetical protein [Chloroflexota bacterium]
MNSLENSLKAAMNLLPAVVFIGLSDMIRGIIEPEVEKRLGRRLTDWEWRYYIIESYRKREEEHRQQIARQWYQQLVDRKIIHDFVWNNNP